MGEERDGVKGGQAYCDAEDEGAVANVVLWPALVPHAFHRVFNHAHCAEEVIKGVSDGGDAGVCCYGVEELDGTLDEWAGVLDHVDVGEDKACLR